VDEEDKWLCNYCAFNGERYEGQPCRPTQERLDATWADYDPAAP
jgi:hypothetical protein